MRYLFIGIIFLVMSCNGHAGKEQAKNDTANLQEYVGPPMDLEVVTPKSKVTKVADENDSAFLSITILKTSIKVKVRDKAAALKNGQELDEFITTNKSLIDPNKIVLGYNHDGSYAIFKSVIDVIQKHDYYRIRIAIK